MTAFADAAMEAAYMEFTTGGDDDGGASGAYRCRLKRAIEKYGSITTPATAGAREEPTSEQIKQLAIKLCDIDEFGPLSSHPPGTGDFNPRWAEFALGYDKPDDPHSGDCIKQPWTCTRCLRAEYEQKALAALHIAAPPAQPAGGEIAEPFQARVQPWMLKCFNAEIAADKVERNDRFLEEALELVQASGCSKERAYALVDYVFGRPQGDINQEVGGVMVTLAAHCLAHGVDMHEAGETELARINQPDIVVKIRANQAAKPKGSALPLASPGGGSREEIAETFIVDEEEGPVSGIVIDLPGGGQIWAGEVSRQAFQRQPQEVQDELVDDSGTLIVRALQGEIEILGRAATVDAGIEIVRALAQYTIRPSGLQITAGEV